MNVPLTNNEGGTIGSAVVIRGSSRFSAVALHITVNDYELSELVSQGKARVVILPVEAPLEESGMTTENLEKDMRRSLTQRRRDFFAARSANGIR